MNRKWKAALVVAVLVALATAERVFERAAIAQRTAASNAVPSYAQVVGAVNRLCAPSDRVVTAAGGLPEELAVNWFERSL